MGKIIRLTCFLAVAVFLSILPAKADTLTYDLTGGYGVDVTFSLPQDPAFTSASFGFIVPVSGLSGVSSIDFYNSANNGGLGTSGYQLSGPQLYTYTSGSLALSTGTFNLNGYGSPFTLTVTDTQSAGDPVSSPEPASFAMLASGLVGIGLFRRRKASLNF